MTKVLVVDDSALMRRLLGGVLTDAGFQVQMARNGCEAVQRVNDWEPDVVTLDINMPEMDGLTALSLIMQARPTPVVMVSSLTEAGTQATLEALALGAVDFIAKPDGSISRTLGDIGAPLVAKVRTAARARLKPPRKSGTTTSAREPARARLGDRPAPAVPAAPIAARSNTAHDSLSRLRAATPLALARCAGVVLIGVSTGGPRTLEEILPALPDRFPWPVVVAQHMPSSFTDALARRLDKLCALRVQEVNSTLPLQAGHIYIGKGGTDMVLAERLSHVVVMPEAEHADHPWHPSVDVLVDSANRLMPARRLIGVQLTGMGNDGAQAMSRLHAEGGRTIAESEDSAVVFGMPQELIQRGGASVVLPCSGVATQLQQWLTAA